jgi:hypothetical protein
MVIVNKKMTCYSTLQIKSGNVATLEMAAAPLRTKKVVEKAPSPSTAAPISVNGEARL